MTYPCPRCERPTPGVISARGVHVCHHCGNVLAGAEARTAAALQRVARALADPDVPHDLAAQLGVRITARQHTLDVREARPVAARPPPPAAAQASELAPINPPPLVAEGPPTLWARLGPAFAENLLFVLGAFLLLAGAGYFASTAWTTMTGATRLLVVEGGLLGFGAVLAGLGRLLNRDGRLDDLEAIVRPLAAGTAALACLAAGRLWQVDALWAGVGGLVGVGATAAAGHWAGGRAAGRLAGAFALAAWLIPWLAAWPVIAMSLLVAALVGVAPWLPTRPSAAAAPLAAWLVAGGHALLSAPGSVAVLGLGVAGLGLAWVRVRLRQPAGVGDRAALALAVGGTPIALADPAVALLAAAVGAGAALWLGVRRDHRPALVAGLALALVAYVLSPAPVRDLLAPFRAGVATDLGYAGRLPLAWYALTCLPYLLGAGFFAQRLATARPRLAALAHRWTTLVALSLAGLAASGPDARPAAIGWLAEGAVVLGLGLWARRPGLTWVGAGLAAAALPAGVVAWAWPAALLPAGWAALAWALAALGAWRAEAPPRQVAEHLAHGAALAVVSVTGFWLVEPALSGATGLGLGLTAALLWWPTRLTASGLVRRAAVLALAVPAYSLGAWSGLAGGTALAPVVAAALVSLDPRHRRDALTLGALMLVGALTPNLSWPVVAALAGATAVLLRTGEPRAAALAGLGPAVVGVAAAVLLGGMDFAALGGLIGVVLGGALRWIPAHPAVHAAAPWLAALGWYGVVFEPVWGGALLIVGMALAPRLGAVQSGLWAGLGGLGVFQLAVTLPALAGLPSGSRFVGAGSAVLLTLATGARWPGGAPVARRVAAAMVGVVAAWALVFPPELAWGLVGLAVALAAVVWADGHLAAAASVPLVVLGVYLAGQPLAADLGWALMLLCLAGLAGLGTRDLRGFRRLPTWAWALAGALLALMAGAEHLPDLWAQSHRPALRGWAVLAWGVLAATVVAGHRPWRPRGWLVAALAPLAWFAPLTGLVLGTPERLTRPTFELLALAAVAARLPQLGWARSLALVGVLGWPGGWTHWGTPVVWATLLAVQITIAWRGGLLDRAGALWLGVGAAGVALTWAVGASHPLEASLWPGWALAFAVAGMVAPRLGLEHSVYAAAGAVGLVLGAVGGPAMSPAGVAAACAAGAGAAWVFARLAGARGQLLWGTAAALAAIHATLAQHTGWLQLLDGHHLEVWSAGALAIVAWPGEGPRLRAARPAALKLVWPALVFAGGAAGLARAAALAALVYGAASRQATEPRRRWIALAFANLAVAALWFDQAVVDPAFYGLPIGLTLVAIAEVDRARLSVRGHVGLLAVGLTVGYGAVAAQIFRVGSATHAVVLAGLGLLTLAAGWRWQRGVLLIAGAAATALAATGHLIRAGFQRGFTGAGVLVVAGLVVLVAGAVAARRRR